MYRIVFSPTGATARVAGILTDALKTDRIDDVIEVDLTAVTEHSMLRSVAAGRPDADDAKVLQEYAARIRAKLAAGDLSIPKVPGMRPYKELPNDTGGIICTENCVECGQCVPLCPMGAISEEDPRVTDDSLCIGCMRCTCVCPAGARMLAPEKQAFIKGLLESFAGGRKENEFWG